MFLTFICRHSLLNILIYYKSMQVAGIFTTLAVKNHYVLLHFSAGNFSANKLHVVGLANAFINPFIASPTKKKLVLFELCFLSFFPAAVYVNCMKSILNAPMVCQSPVWNRVSASRVVVNKDSLINIFEN